jgi:hypothetical protein
MEKAKTKMLFIFNQLINGTLLAGGEVRGLKVFQLFKNDPEFLVSAMYPKKAGLDVGDSKTYLVGENSIESYIYSSGKQYKPYWLFILYLARSLESFKYLVNIDVDAVYSTGDFFCDTIPAFVIKFFHPKTKWVCCVHHINESPLVREKVKFTSAAVSYVSQRLSFLLILISCDQVLSINPIVKKYLLKWKISESKIFVVGNGLDVKYLDEFREKNIELVKENKICFFARLNVSKGAGLA